MKKLIITGAACTAMSLSSFAQGFINFQNAISTQYYFNSTASTANKISSATIGSQLGISDGGVVDVALYWSTAAFTDPSQATLAATETFGATAGTLAGSSSLAISGTSPNQQIFVQVYAWDSTFATPAAALAGSGWFGASSAGQSNSVYGSIGAAELVTLGAAAPAPGGVVYGTSAPFFGRTVVLQSPEPATLALGGLGAAALLMFRRRK